MVPEESKSGYRGVYPSSYGSKWYSLIKAGPRRRYLGTFPTARSAALAYDRAADELHGDQAKLNFSTGRAGDQRHRW